MSSNVEQKIGKYEVLSKIGEGGMGVVYKAKDPLIDRIVAIKMMTGAFAEEKESRERFLREARAVGKLQHNNIVTIYELGVEGNSPYMVMEFLEGKGLDRILAERIALTMVQKLEYMEQICNALHYAHEHDIVHRDVKPANVIVMKGGTQVKLVDFGIARAGNSGMTRTGFAIGTTSYMSPEQIEASKGLDRRSDVFSAGVMMYEVLTNNLPFPGTEPIAIAIKILREPYPRLAAYLAEYPAELDDIMARALAKDRDERYSTAEEMAFDLSRLIENLKRNMVSQYVVEGRESFDKKDFSRAKELISYVLKIDPGNSQARQLNYEIQKMAQVAQKGEHLKQLKAAIEETIGQRQYDEALNFIEQALKLDTSSAELMKQKELVLAEQQRRAEVKKRLNLAQSAEANGDFRLAREHVEKALSLDPTDTQARMVKGNIEAALAEQERQKQIREFLDVAKSEMVDRRFTSAREAIKRAEALQPDSPEIQALKAAAYSAHEQELKRREIEQLAKDVQASLAIGDPEGGLKKANAALQMYPTDVTLLQLRTTAEQQRAELSERQRTEKAKQEHLKKAKDALGRKNYAAAIAELEGARIEFPADKEIADLLRLAREEQENAKLSAEKASHQAAASAAAAAEAARKKAAEDKQRAEEQARHQAEEKRRAEEKARRDAEEKKAAEEKARREAREADEKRREEEKRKAEEKRRRDAEAARIAAEAAAKLPATPSSATSIFSSPSASAAAPAPAPSAYEETIVAPPPPKKAETKEKPRREERREPVHVPAPEPSGGKGKMIGIGAAVAVLVIGAVSYFVFSPGKKPTTDTTTTTSTTTGTSEGTTTPPATVPVPAPPKPEFGTLSVVAKDDKGANVDGADIFIDNQLKDVQVKRGKASIKLPVGTHTVRVQSANGVSTDQSVTIAKDASAQLAFALKASSVPVPKVTYLIISTIAGATVTVDGKALPVVGPDGKASTEVQPGRHTVEVQMRGYKPFSSSVTAKEGDRAAVAATLAALPAPTADFSASAANIREGESADLKWNTSGAAQVTLDGAPVSASDHKSVSPRTTTTYKLVANGDGGATTKEVTITVAAAPKTPIVGAFAASAASITKGEKTTLTWSTQNATDVSISGIGKVDPSGSRDVTPSETTTYKLTAKSAGGSVDSQPLKVTVNPPAPTGPSPADMAAEQKAKDVADATAAVNSFKAAFEAKNLDALQQAWPSMPSAIRGKLGEAFKLPSKYTLTCKTPTINGDNATATCGQVVNMQGNNYSAQLTVDLQKAGGTWKVVNQKGTQK